MASAYPSTVEPVASPRDAPVAPDPGATGLDVLFLSASGQVGGAERVLLDLVAGMREADPRRRLGLLLAADGPLADAARAAGATVIRLPFPAALARLGDAGLGDGGTNAGLAGRMVVAVPGAIAYAVRLARVLRAHPARTLHTNGLKMHALVALLRPRGARLVWHLHDFTGGRRIMAGVLRALAHRADAVIANSRAVADDWRAVAGRSATTVHNAVDMARFHPVGPAADLDALAGVPAAPPDTVRVGLVATLATWKGHDVFLRAIARLPRDVRMRAYVVSGAIYETAGSQASLDALRALAQRLGIDDRVAFTGFAPDSSTAMRALDVIVHASTRPEPFGLVIAEGMASGRAVIVSAAGGAVELIDDGVDALSFAPGDDAALAARLEHLVRDGALRARLGRAARASAESRFERARMVREVAAVHAAAAGETS